MSKYRYITNSGRSGYYKKWNDSKFSNIPNLMDFWSANLFRFMMLTKLAIKICSFELKMMQVKNLGM